MSRRLTSDSVIFGYHAQIGVIRTFIGGEGASGIQPKGNLPDVDCNVKARSRSPDAANRVEMGTSPSTVGVGAAAALDRGVAIGRCLDPTCPMHVARNRAYWDELSDAGAASESVFRPSWARSVNHPGILGYFLRPSSGISRKMFAGIATSSSVSERRNLNRPGRRAASSADR